MAKWTVFERSLLECQTIIQELHRKADTLEQKKRLCHLRKKIHKGFAEEFVALGWQDNTLVMNPRKVRTRLSLEA